jgi:hypothetical protein
MDPVSLTLGILPLLCGAIKGYGLLHKKLKVFCHYSRDVRRVRKHFDRQRQFFHNETHILLRRALDEELTVECMLDDASHATWESRELEAAFRRLLAKNYDTCLDIIEEINAGIEELQQEMECFTQVELQGQKAWFLLVPIFVGGANFCRESYSKIPSGVFEVRSRLRGTKASSKPAWRNYETRMTTCDDYANKQASSKSPNRKLLRSIDTQVANTATAGPLKEPQRPFILP